MFWKLQYAYATLLRDDARPCDREARAYAWATGIATTAMTLGVILGVAFTC